MTVDISRQMTVDDKKRIPPVDYVNGHSSSNSYQSHNNTNASTPTSSSNSSTANCTIDHCLQRYSDSSTSTTLTSTPSSISSSNSLTASSSGKSCEKFMDSASLVTSGDFIEMESSKVSSTKNTYASVVASAPLNGKYNHKNGSNDEVNPVDAIVGNSDNDEYDEKDGDEEDYDDDDDDSDFEEYLIAADGIANPRNETPNLSCSRIPSSSSRTLSLSPSRPPVLSTSGGTIVDPFSLADSIKSLSVDEKQLNRKELNSSSSDSGIPSSQSSIANENCELSKFKISTNSSTSGSPPLSASSVNASIFFPALVATPSSSSSSNCHGSPSSPTTPPPLQNSTILDSVTCSTLCSGLLSPKLNSAVYNNNGYFGGQLSSPSSTTSHDSWSWVRHINIDRVLFLRHLPTTDFHASRYYRKVLESLLSLADDNESEKMHHKQQNEIANSKVEIGENGNNGCSNEKIKFLHLIHRQKLATVAAHIRLYYGQHPAFLILNDNVDIDSAIRVLQSYFAELYCGQFHNRDGINSKPSVWVLKAADLKLSLLHVQHLVRPNEYALTEEQQEQRSFGDNLSSNRKLNHHSHNYYQNNLEQKHRHYNGNYIKKPFGENYGNNQNHKHIKQNINNSHQNTASHSNHSSSYNNGNYKYKDMNSGQSVRIGGSDENPPTFSNESEWPPLS